MRKLRASILLTIVALFMFVAMMKPTQQVNAVAAVRIYTVRWVGTCPIWPPLPHGMVVGEWTRECDGYWHGWGSEPGDSCTFYDLEYGDLCEY